MVVAMEQEVMKSKKFFADRNWENFTSDETVAGRRAGSGVVRHVLQTASDASCSSTTREQDVTVTAAAADHHRTARTIAPRPCNRSSSTLQLPPSLCYWRYICDTSIFRIRLRPRPLPQDRMTVDETLWAGLLSRFHVTLTDMLCQMSRH